MAIDKEKYPNLVDINDQPEEKRLEIQRKGQAAAVIARKKNRSMQESFAKILSMAASDDFIEKYMVNKAVATQLQRDLHDSGEKVTEQDVIGLVMNERSKIGDVKAAIYMRDSSGNMPVKEEKQTVTLTNGVTALMQAIANRNGIDPDEFLNSDNSQDD